MITFNDIIGTKKELNDTIKLVERVKNLDSSYNYEKKLNEDLMKNANTLIGKYFREKVKAKFHTYIDVNNGTTSETLEISKSGIGRTPKYCSNICLFERMVGETHSSSYYDSGLINDVITEKEIFEKAKSHLSENAVYVLDSIKEVYEKHKIKPPASTNKQVRLGLNPEESNILSKQILHIDLSDSHNGIRMAFSKNKDTGYRQSQIFELTSLELSSEPDFIWLLLVNNHREEITNIINNYIEETKENLDTWKAFNEELKEKLAKFLVLMQI